MEAVKSAMKSGAMGSDGEGGRQCCAMMTHEKNFVNEVEMIHRVTVRANPSFMS